MPKVIVTRRWPKEVEAVLKDKFDVVLNEDDHPFSQDELAGAFANADALSSKRLAGAALDVYEAEPDVVPALMQLDKRRTGPSSGQRYTGDARGAMGLRVIENLERFFAGDQPPDVCT